MVWFIVYLALGFFLTQEASRSIYHEMVKILTARFPGFLGETLSFFAGLISCFLCAVIGPLVLTFIITGRIVGSLTSASKEN